MNNGRIKSLSLLFIFCSYLYISIFFSLGFETLSLSDLLRACLQSVVSSVCVFIIGVLGAFGLASVNRSYHIYLFPILLLPQILPSNLFMISLLVLSDFFRYEFRDFWAVIVSHIFLNLGLSSIILFLTFEQSVFSFYDLASVFKIKKMKLFFLLLRSHLFNRASAILIFFLILHGLSFSIPIIVSEKIMSFEQVLYDSMLSGKSSAAALVCLLLYYLASLTNISSLVSEESNSFSKLSRNKAFVLLTIIPNFLVISSLVSISLSLVEVKIDFDVFMQALFGTSKILIVGQVLFFISIISGLSYNYTKEKFYKFFIPSASLLIFSGHLLSSYLSDYLVIGLSSFLSVFLFTSLFLSKSFERLGAFDDLIKVFSLKDKLSLFLKTEKKTVMLSFSLLMFWMSGDYVFSSNLSRSVVSFGSLSRASLSRYELVESRVYSLSSLFCSLLFILFFWMVIYGKSIKSAN